MLEQSAALTDRCSLAYDDAVRMWHEEPLADDATDAKIRSGKSKIQRPEHFSENTKMVLREGRLEAQQTNCKESGIAEGGLEDPEPVPT